MTNTPTIVNSSNLSSWFSISDADGISSWSGNTLTVSGVSGNERVKLTALVDMAISFDYTATSYCKISFNGQYISEDGEDGSYSGTLLTGQSFYFSISNTVTTRTGTFTNISCTKMEKKVCYVGVDGKARKVKKIYVGANNVAQRVRKAYVGVGGVARIWWTTGLEYDGTATSLRAKVYAPAATTIGDYATFAGGLTSSTSATNYVTRYNKSLTRSSGSNLSNARGFLVATTVGNYGVFAGGANCNQNSSGSMFSVVDAIIASGTVTQATEECSRYAFGKAAATAGNYAFFAGGVNFSDSRGRDIDCYDSSLTYVENYMYLNEYSSWLAATTLGNCAIFAGGKGGTRSTSSEMVSSATAMDSSLTKHTPDELSTGRMDLAATTVGNYALFCGGYGNGSSAITVIDVYNQSLTRTMTLSTVNGRRNCSAITLGNYAIFAGGGGDIHFNDHPTAVDVFDKSLTRVNDVGGISTGRAYMAAATIGSYALFGGGKTNHFATSGTTYNTVDVYTV